MDVDAALTYLEFVEARHRAWEARQRGEPPPWTDEPIVATRKFTNVYRVLDYGSQFLVRELLTPNLEPRDALWRCFLYRYTNLPATWMHLRDQLGHYPFTNDSGRLVRLIQEKAALGPVFSGAYVILPAPGKTGDKVQHAVDLSHRLFMPQSPDYVIDDFLAAKSQEARFNVLRRNPGVGDFMAMQILTDWGYSPQCGEDRENEFVVLGPGAKKGARAIDPGNRNLMQTFDWAVSAVRASADCPLLEGRPPSLMDIQNTLCEYSKHARFQLRPTPAKPYAPSHPGPQAPPVLPQHWYQKGHRS